jgi:PAS domain S-box-containing protein
VIGHEKCEARNSANDRVAVVDRRYRALVEAVPAHAIFVAKANGEMLEDSPRFRQISGQSLDQYLRDGWMETLHPDERALADREWLSALQQQRVYDCEHRLRVATGEYRWFAAYAVPVIEEGEVIEWVGTFNDIHARKVLGEGARFLTDANELFAATLDEQTVLARLTASAVPAFADWCGIALSPADGVAPAKAEVIREVSDEMLAAYAPDAATLESLRKLNVHSVMLVPMSVRGATFGVVRLMASRPDRHYGQEELQLASEFAHRAAIALDKARLYALATNANRAKDIFLATLSHEMKTPLTAILGWARMLRSDGPSSEIFDEALEAIEQSAQVQERLIEDILDVSRVITGKMHLEMKRVDIRNVITEAVEVVRPTADQNGVRLRIRDDAAFAVSGDEMRLRQVIWNLMINAVKFTPPGGFIEIELSRSDTEGCITVRDTGRGIRADFLPHVFDQFQQAMLADRAQHHGLGLGLAIVRYLVVAHGGRVEAHSEGEGKGAEFVVTLPLLLDSETVAEERPEYQLV